MAPPGSQDIVKRESTVFLTGNSILILETNGMKYKILGYTFLKSVTESLPAGSVVITHLETKLRKTLILRGKKKV